MEPSWELELSEILGRLYYWITKRGRKQLQKEKHIIEVGSLKIKRPLMNAFRLSVKRICALFQAAEPRWKVFLGGRVDGNDR
jgi:hypothetical protein